MMDIPLAVNWNYFEVTLNDNVPNINWSADYQQGTVFEIQRSYDGRNFSKIKIVSSEAGRSTYGYDDIFVNNQQAVAFYRIKSIEVSGAEKFTPVRTVKFNNKGNSLAYTAPNPFKNSFIINYKAAENEMITIRMFNVNGQQKMVKVVSINKGANTITIPDAERFASGIYIIQITNSHNQVSTSKVVKQ
jgi:hypothetical protein